MTEKKQDTSKEDVKKDEAQKKIDEAKKAGKNQSSKDVKKDDKPKDGGKDKKEQDENAKKAVQNAKEKAKLEKEQAKKEQEEAIARAKEEGKAEAMKEMEEKLGNIDMKNSKEIDEQIKAIQKKKKDKGYNENDKIMLDRLMKKRAQVNSKRKADLNVKFPSQMTLDEMKEYCDDNEVEYEKGDTTVILRQRIKAFRNPAQADRLRQLLGRGLEGKVVR